jgi:GNAT superfamily N-acetyltransferase
MTDPSPITLRPLTPADWPAVEQLLGGTKGTGVGGGCWCMWPRIPRGGKMWQEAKGEKNRGAFRRLVKAGKVHAVLAFAGAEPVGWCCFGPRESFARLRGIKALQREFGADTWSIVCFYIATGWRRKGLGSRLLEAATAHAFELGAREIEGYPVVYRSAPNDAPSAFAWTGVPKLFTQAGYNEIDRPSATRPLYVITQPRADEQCEVRP